MEKAKTNLLDAALAYAQRGFKVFPLAPNTKIPTKGSGGFKDATDDTNQIAAWWSENPNFNIGIAAGLSNLFSLDIDDKPGGEKGDIKSFIAEHGHIPECPIVHSINGDGKQYYLRVPDCVTIPGRSGENPLAPGIDCKCEGGYVVAPPSIARTETGEPKQYRWDDKHNLETCMIPEIPDWLVKLAQNTEKGKSVTTATDNNGKLIIASGRRDSTLTKWAGNFRHYGADIELMNDLLAVVNTRCNPRLDDRQVRKIAESIGKKPDGNVEPEMHVVWASDVETKPIEWLWPGVIPLCSTTGLFGNPDEGKSYLSLDIAARISTGAVWPDDPYNKQPVGKVLLISGEDSRSRVINARLDGLGADRANIAYFDAVKYQGKKVFFALDKHLETMEKLIESIDGLRLVVIDPIAYYLGDADSHKDAAVRQVLDPLLEMAERCQIAILFISHYNKSSSSDPFLRAMGSLAFTASPRAAWCLDTDYLDPNGRQRLLMPIKCNLNPEKFSLRYEMIDGKLEWDGTHIKMTASEYYAKKIKDSKTPIDFATDFLQEKLKDRPMPTDYLEFEARRHGISDRTLKRAKKDLKIHSEKEGFGENGKWLWTLPKSGK